MLSDPPCIGLLVGCSETTTYGSSSSPSSTVQSSSSSSHSSFFGTRSSKSSSMSSSSSLGQGLNSFYGFSSSNSSSSSLGLSSSIKSIYGPGKQAVAVYSIQLKNSTAAALNNLQILHGPLPAEYHFLPSVSDAGCMMNGQYITCAKNLAANQATALMISYNAGSSTGCTAEKALQNVSVSGAQATVSCTMREATSAEFITESQSSSSLSSSSFSSVSSSVSSLSTAIIANVDTGSNGSTTGYKPGYKPYVQPRTGASNTLYAALTQQTTPFSAVNSQGGVGDSALVTAIFLMGIVLVFASVHKRLLVRL